MAIPPETMPKVIVCGRWSWAAKSYSVDCVHGIGLLLWREKYPTYDLEAAEEAQRVLSSENDVICAYVRYERAMEVVGAID